MSHHFSVGQTKRENGATRVLIVDDDRAVLDVTSGMLQRLGMTCVTAETIAQARSLLLEDRCIDVAVLGFNIGRGTSAALLPELRSQRADVLVIGNSGSNHSDVFAFMGVPDFMLKPWSASQFLSILRSRLPANDRALIGSA